MKTQLPILLIGLAALSCKDNKPVSSERPGADSVAVTAKGHWIDSLDALAQRDSCGIRIKEQMHRLEADTSEQIYTLEKYPAAGCGLEKLAPLDLKSCPSAGTFKTKIAEGLRDSGINFAGCYSLVNVPMTGAGDNYWIVDRRNGKAREFPYKAVYISFSKQSKLVIINPKEKILAAIREAEGPEFACAYINTGEPKLHTDLNPYYVLWKDGSWQVVAPHASQPPVNNFWKEYFGRK